MITAMQYKDAVSKGRLLVNQAKDIHYKIAEAAIEVCDLTIGGDVKGRYTLKGYANDIGMNHSTLQTWVREYKNVVSKLPKTEKPNRVAVREVLANTKKGDDIIKAYRKSCDNLNCPDASLLIEDCKRLASISFRVGHGWDLKKMDQEKLKRVLILTNTISGNLMKHFKEDRNLYV